MSQGWVDMTFSILTLESSPSSDPGAAPGGAALVLMGAESRAGADGRLWVCGMGRALCTGLGSPDFILEATRMAGIFSPRPPGNRTLPSCSRRVWKFYYFVSKNSTLSDIWSGYFRYAAGETRVQFAPDGTTG